VAIYTPEWVVPERVVPKGVMYGERVIVRVEPVVRSVDDGLVSGSVDNFVGRFIAHFDDVTRLVIRHMDQLRITLANANKAAIVLNNDMLGAG
jgi:hypothetical protein